MRSPYKLKKSLEDRFMEKVYMEPNSGCWLWDSSVTIDGYGRFRTKERTEHAHRASYKIFKDGISGGLYVLHKCDVRSCVNPHHLFLGTQKDNMDDMNAKSRRPRGEDHPNSKLNSVQVRIIRRLLESGIVKQKTIAELFNVSTQPITLINTGKGWDRLSSEGGAIGNIFAGRVQHE